MSRNRLFERVGVRESRAGFVLVLFAYCLFSLLDWVTTTLALTRGAREGNPIASSLYDQYGAWGLLLFKSVVVAVIILVLVYIPRRVMSQRVALWVGTIFAVVAAFIVIHNAAALSQLYPAMPWGADDPPVPRLI